MRVSLLFLILLGAASLPGFQGATDPAGEAMSVLAVESYTSDLKLTSRRKQVAVEVQGVASPASDVVVRLVGVVGESTLSRMEKTGPFWLASGQVRFGSVPQICLSRSSAPVSEILSSRELERWGLGRAALYDSIELDANLDRALYVGELFRIKEDSGAYSFSDSGVRLGPGGRFSATLPLPEGTPAGSYELDVFAVGDRRIIAREVREVRVRAVGLSAWLGMLARDHGFLYGCLAVILAMLTGILAGVLFRGQRPRKPPKTRDFHNREHRDHREDPGRKDFTADERG